MGNYVENFLCAVNTSPILCGYFQTWILKIEHLIIQTFIQQMFIISSGCTRYSLRHFGGMQSHRTQLRALIS